MVNSIGLASRHLFLRHVWGFSAHWSQPPRAGRSEHPVGYGSPRIEGNSLALSEAQSELMEEQ